MGSLSVRAKKALGVALSDDVATREVVAAINQGEALPIPEASVQSLVSDLAAKATDSLVVHLAGIETIAGAKTFSAAIAGSITGNAGTATNGVVTTGSYSDPSWLASIAGSKVAGSIPGNAATVTDGVVTTGSYSDPSWVASLAGSKLTGSVQLPARRNTRRTATFGLPIVTNRLGALGNGTYSNVGTDTSCTSKMAHQCAQVLSCVRFVYSNWNLTGSSSTLEADPGNAITVAASIEYPSGTKVRLYFGGAASVTIAAGGQVISDPVWVYIPAATVFWSNTYVSCTNAQKWYFTRQMIPGSGLIESSNAQYNGGDGTDQTAPGTATLSGGTSARFMFGPTAVIGTTATTGAEPVCVAGLGDSILAGVGRAVSSSGNLGSWFERGMGAVGCINLGQGSSKMSGAAATPSVLKQRLALCSSCDYVICNWGINDLGGTPSTLSQLQANALTVWGFLSLQGIRVYQATLCPNTSSTDVWATLANQTVRATEATRTGFNTWIRGGAPTSAGVAVAVGTGGALVAGQSGHQLTGYIDIASKVEVDAANAATLNGGLWSVGNVYTTDGLGVHPSDAGHTACGTAINTSVFVAY